MKILLIVQSEVCYHPRLLKAADYFIGKGVEVIVYNSITGLATEKIYHETIRSRKWKLFENDISKRSPKSYVRWLFSSLFYKANSLVYGLTGRWLFYKHGATKALLLFPKILRKQNFDFVYINLVDALPFAFHLSRKNRSKIIYDCQEYFKGQFAEQKGSQYKWVKRAEDQFAKSTYLVLGTTNIMLNRLQKDFGTIPGYLRVRNLPIKINLSHDFTEEAELKLIWHGLNIIPENIRGVHILLNAVSKCRTPVHLFLQGIISEQNKIRLNELTSNLKISDKVSLVSPASPDKIVESLLIYDVGLAGEIAAEDNQRLTSSNKLFEYIYAGLAVVVPDLPGLAETVLEFKVGKLYEQGNFLQLAELIDNLNMNRVLLRELKEASIIAANNELYWEHDFDEVWKYIN